MSEQIILPEVLKQLIEKYDFHKEGYRKDRYNEAQLRLNFTDHLFRALGWDVNNDSGYSEAYKEVLIEEPIKIGATTLFIDYTFRIGGIRKFIVETKKPSVKIKDDAKSALQVRRYAWNAKLPLNILTNFEEFAVYDCTIKPQHDDTAATGRIEYFTWQDLPKKWEWLASIFTKESILKGSFDKYAKETKGKRGTANVDDTILAEIEEWRDVLAKNIALRNSALSVDELNDAVQKTIDRILFLRICEDRGIEPYGCLQKLIEGENTYQRLCDLFRRADERYNSGLFHFNEEKDNDEIPDRFTLNLTIDDKVLKGILKRLYYPESPFEFSVIPPVILGHVYEQFLGKVIRLTEGHQAKVEYKPEVKKAGGVFYTPQYIVDYIVKQTVGELVKDKTPREVAKLRILDPACGSGSFLLGAYQYLLNYHRDWYIANLVPVIKEKSTTSPEIKALLPEPAPKGGKAKGPVYDLPIYQAGNSGDQRVRSDWKLTTAERKRILLNNIYGVDIDRQAVEVTKLSLLLKVLEEESQETVAKQLTLFQERALPSLHKNIKCGNSLIGTDIYQDVQVTLDNPEVAKRINAFDWGGKYGFPEVIQAGGFDAVIGNPPYVRIQKMIEWAPIEVEYYKKSYSSAKMGNYDIYVVFVERGLSLIKKQGLLGFILPHKFFNSNYGEGLRSLISSNKYLKEIVQFGDQQIFVGAHTYTCLLFLNKSGNKSFVFSKVHNLEEWRNAGKSITGIIDSIDATSNEWNFVVGNHSLLFKKLNEIPTKCKDLTNIFVGLQTSADTVFLFKQFEKSKEEITIVKSKELDQEFEIETSLLKPVVRSGNIGRYWAKPTALVLFPYKLANGKAEIFSESEMKTYYPKSWKYLSENKKILSEREHGKFKGDNWYQLYPKNLEFWEQPKIMVPYMITRLSACYDEHNYYFVNVTTGGFGITCKSSQISLKYLTGLLNSKLLDLYLKNVSTNFRGGYFAANKQILDQLPIRTVDFSNSLDKNRHDKIVTLVDRIYDLNNQISNSKIDHEKTLIQGQIDAIDREIDKIVYELYNLTEDEISIIDNHTNEI